ncbi:MAG: N-methyltryptophan oxidase [Rhizobiales bacterium PAR1]|nr:MAG: N-methyltryptophan oxidase [Rhizobiales bacterium PAR1]
MRYDTIVVGLGIMGSATLATLAARGKKVLGIERFDLGHAMGSSHGVNRIIRIGYFEGAAYVPMVQRASRLWTALGDRLGEKVMHVTGTLDCAPETSPLTHQSRASCQVNNLPYEELDGEEIGRRFPGFRVPKAYRGIFQPDGGFVASDRALAGYQTLAIADGAEIRAREAMLGYEPTPGGGVKVRTASGTYEAASLVLTTGGWIGEHVPALKRLAIPERQVLGWFQPKNAAHFMPDKFPASILKTEDSHFYQFPLWGAPGFKIGAHRHLYQQSDAETLDRNVYPEDEALLRKGLEFAFPEANGACLRLASCHYTITPDEHFILDHLPGSPQIVVASPCSGHGFKFGSVFGEVLADMASGKAPAFDLTMFRMGRFAT